MVWLLNIYSYFNGLYENNTKIYIWIYFTESNKLMDNWQRKNTEFKCTNHFFQADEQWPYIWQQSWKQYHHLNIGDDQKKMYCDGAWCRSQSLLYCSTQVHKTYTGWSLAEYSGSILGFQGLPHWKKRKVWLVLTIEWLLGLV